MKKIVLVLFTIVLFQSCSKNPDQFIPYINGYWEIESVTLQNGTIKEYKISETIDFITLNDNLHGFRKKMKPQFNGKYKAFKDSEAINLKIENDSLNLYYKMPFATWKETVLLASETQLKIVNQNNDIYTYKRFKPININ